jgi:hypothetical protein
VVRGGVAKSDGVGKVGDGAFVGEGQELELVMLRLVVMMVMGLRASYVGLSLGCLDVTVVAVFEFEKVAEQPANRRSELFLESGFRLTRV